MVGRPALITLTALMNFALPFWAVVGVIITRPKTWRPEESVHSGTGITFRQLPPGYPRRTWGFPVAAEYLRNDGEVDLVQEVWF